MIDPHSHLRDGKQAYKETVKHGLEVGYRAGLDAVFEMPNTDPALTSEKTIEERLVLADDVLPEIPIFHGVYAGITADPKQIEEVVEVYNRHRETDYRVVGLKMFAGHSTGNMGIIDGWKQLGVYQKLAELDYRGVLAVHCEKESFLLPGFWDASDPFTHTLARPAVAESASIADQIRFAKMAGYKGTLHICHISNPRALRYIESIREDVPFKITVGLTPHHAVLYDEMMSKDRVPVEDGLLLKMNPPLRTKAMQEYMFQALLDGRIDWVETDHAPHSLAEKTGKVFKDGEPVYASGIPGFAFYPVFIRLLRAKLMSEEQIYAVTHDNIVKAFGLPEDLIPNTRRAGTQTEAELRALADEYEFDAFKVLELSGF